VFVRCGVLLLRIPQRFCQCFEHLVFSRMGIAVFSGECRMYRRNPGRPVRAYLLAQCEMQAHVQEGIGLIAGAIVQESIDVTRNDVMVLRMFSDNCADLRLKRSQNFIPALFSPGFGIHFSQLGTIVTEDHVLAPLLVFLRYSHRSAITHCGHSGLRALQT